MTQWSVTAKDPNSDEIRTYLLDAKDSDAAKAQVTVHEQGIAEASQTDAYKITKAEKAV